MKDIDWVSIFAGAVVFAATITILTILDAIT